MILNKTVPVLSVPILTSGAATVSGYDRSASVVLVFGWNIIEPLTCRLFAVTVVRSPHLMLSNERPDDLK